MLEMCSISALYHAWPTLRGRLAPGLSLPNLRVVVSLRAFYSASGLYLHYSIGIITLICMLVWY